MQLFGFEITRKTGKELPSVVPPSSIESGATVINTGVNAGGYYGMVMDLEGVIKNENDLIRRYREISQYSDCDGAIDEGPNGYPLMTSIGVNNVCPRYGACLLHSSVCHLGEWRCAYEPQPEVCDGIDNDCNALVDDGLGTSSLS